MLRDGQPFRPWGLLQKILSSYSGQNWAFVGCANLEDRCSCAYYVMSNLGTITSPLIFHLQNFTSRYVDEAEEKTRENYECYTKAGVTADCFHEYRVDGAFSQYATAIDRYLDNIEEENLLIDITSMPKKLMFYIIKKLHNSYDNISNIIFTYTEPAEYSEDSLAENHCRWTALPGFQSPRRIPDTKKTVIAIGFEPLGLPNLAESGELESGTVALLFPFPSPPSNVAKNWTFIRELFPNTGANTLDIQRVDGTNVPEIFDALNRLGDEGQTYLTLAPFGPKPVSLAMALYATKYADQTVPPSVFYTQPKVYNPNYSRGILLKNKNPAVNCYCIRRNNQDAY